MRVENRDYIRVVRRIMYIFVLTLDHYLLHYRQRLHALSLSFSLDMHSTSHLLLSTLHRKMPMKPTLLRLVSGRVLIGRSLRVKTMGIP